MINYFRLLCATNIRFHLLFREIIKTKKHEQTVIFKSDILTEINELTDKINTTSKELAESQSVYTQLKMKAESEVSLKAVEEFARNELFMFEVGPSQYNYISLSNGKDKSEIKNIANDSIFDKIKKCFK